MAVGGRRVYMGLCRQLYMLWLCGRSFSLVMREEKVLAGAGGGKHVSNTGAAVEVRWWGIVAQAGVRKKVLLCSRVS